MTVCWRLEGTVARQVSSFTEMFRNCIANDAELLQTVQIQDFVSSLFPILNWRQDSEWPVTKTACHDCACRNSFFRRVRNKEWHKYVYLRQHVCAFVRPHVTTRKWLNKFSWNFILGSFNRLVLTFLFWLISGYNNGQITWRLLCFYFCSKDMEFPCYLGYLGSHHIRNLLKRTITWDNPP